MIYPINHLPGDIPVGVQTEQGVEVIGFDLKPWLDALPDMDFSVWHTRPGEKEAYPAKDQMIIGTVLYWHPDSYDTAIAGDGKVEIAGVGDNQRKLSGFVKTSIRATSLGTTKEPGENFPPWYEAVLQAAQDVKVDVNVGTGGLYLVRAAAKEGSYIFRTDRTIEEVREAVAAGKTCILVHDEGHVYTYCGEMPLSTNLEISVPTFVTPPKYKQWDGFEYRQVQMKPDGTALLSGYSVAKTPNPYKLTIGGVDYDGSKAVNVLPAPADTASPAYLRWNGTEYVPATVDSVKAELGGGGTVEVDATLTKANAAADAKVVGDRFTSLSEEIEKIKESGGAGETTGTITKTGTVVIIKPDANTEIEVNGDTVGNDDIVHQGKNFLPSGLNNVPTKTEWGLTAAANEDGSTTITGTATNGFSYFLMHSAFKTERVFPAGKYVATFDANADGVGFPTLNILGKNAEGKFATIVQVAKNNKAVFELETPTAMQAYLQCVAGTYDITVYCQIEYGDVSSAYEPFNATEYAVPLPHTVYAYKGTNILYSKNGSEIAVSFQGDTSGMDDETLEELKALLKFDPSPYGLPVLYLEGNTAGMSKDTAVPLNYKYNGEEGTLTCKWQGNSSLSFPKKNYTLKFDNAFEAVEGWGEQKKYCMKANHNDFTQSRNVVSAKIWGNIVARRTVKNETLAACPNYGAIDGFPVVIVLNGEFHGVYCFNVPKDGWMMNMGSGTNECILCADLHVPATKFEAGNAVLDGSDFKIEYITDEDDTAWAVTSVNNLIGACANSDGTDLGTTIAAMLDWDSAIDYYIYCVMLRHTDGLSKNYLLSTYDGVKWFFTAYDMDTVFGNSWDGKTYVTPITGGTFEEAANENHLFRLIKTYKKDELKTRYNSLRKNALSEAYIAQMFTNYTGSISTVLMQEEAKQWPTIPHTSVNTVDGILNWYRLRCQVIDAEVESWQ